MALYFSVDLQVEVTQEMLQSTSKDREEEDGQLGVVDVNYVFKKKNLLFKYVLRKEMHSTLFRSMMYAK